MYRSLVYTFLLFHSPKSLWDKLQNMKNSVNIYHICHIRHCATTSFYFPIIQIILESLTWLKVFWKLPFLNIYQLIGKQSIIKETTLLPNPQVFYIKNFQMNWKTYIFFTLFENTMKLLSFGVSVLNVWFLVEIIIH